MAPLVSPITQAYIDSLTRTAVKRYFALFAEPAVAWATMLIALLGLHRVLWWAVWLLAALLRPITSRLCGKRHRLASFGKWAVVTGATDGIGKAYATTLAGEGMGVVLVSRSMEKLDATAAEIKAAHPGAEVLTIAADFSGKDADMFARIEKVLGGLDVGILVNNVGQSYPGALLFHELKAHAPTLSHEIVRMNCDSVVQMTSIVLPGMVARKRGAIVNIGSAAGQCVTNGAVCVSIRSLLSTRTRSTHPIPPPQPPPVSVAAGNPLYAVYAGTKAFVSTFSVSLAAEVAGSGIVVQAQIPFFVATKLAKIRATSLFTPSPRGWVGSAVAALKRGASAGVVVVPYWAHAAQDAVLHALPTWLVSWYLMRMHGGLRARYLAKDKGAKGGKAE